MKNYSFNVCSAVFINDMKQMRGLILGGGYGTRLYPLTEKYPKPLLVLDQETTILDVLIKKLQSANGIIDISLVSNRRFFDKYKEWIKKREFQIDLIDDGTNTPEDRLGALGDIGLVIDRYKNSPLGLLVLGGDNLFDWDLDGFIEGVKDHPNDVVLGLYNLKERTEASRFGVAVLDKNKKVVTFEEKPADPESSLVGMCLYWFPVEVFSLIKEYLGREETNKDTSGSFINWLISRFPVYGVVFDGIWLDIGHPDTYSQAQDFFKQGIFG